MVRASFLECMDCALDRHSNCESGKIWRTFWNWKKRFERNEKVQMKLTGRKRELVSSQRCTTNRKWIPFDWRSFRLCIGMRRLDGLHDHRGTHGMLGSRSLRWRTCLARLVHFHSGSWSLALHDKWGNRGLGHREFYANSVRLCDACDAAVQCIERDRPVQPDDTTIQMSVRKKFTKIKSIQHNFFFFKLCVRWLHNRLFYVNCGARLMANESVQREPTKCA